MPAAPRRDGARAAVSLPARAYFDPAWHRDEQRALFPRAWHLAAWEGDLRRAGDRVAYACGPLRALLVRDARGVVRAFEDACPHRGASLCSVDEGPAPCDPAERRPESELRCAFHGWRFGLDGALRAAPGYGPLPRGLRVGDLALSPLPCETLGGFVWVRFVRSRGPTLARYLGPRVTDLFERYESPTLALVGDYTIELDCNWKVGVEGSIETYHARATHAQLESYIDPGASVLEHHAPHSLQRMPFAAPASDREDNHDDDDGEAARRVREREEREALEALLRRAGLAPLDAPAARVRAALQAHKRALGARPDCVYPYARLSDDELVDDLHVGVFPHLVCNLFAETRTVFRFRPAANDPEKLRWDAQFYRVLTEPERARWRRPPLVRTAASPEVLPLEPAATRRVLAQDADVFLRVQRGVHARGFAGPRPGQAEARVRWFHEALRRALRSRTAR